MEVISDPGTEVRTGLWFHPQLLLNSEGKWGFAQQILQCAIAQMSRDSSKAGRSPRPGLGDSQEKSVS